MHVGHCIVGIDGDGPTAVSLGTLEGSLSGTMVDAEAAGGHSTHLDCAMRGGEGGEGDDEKYRVKFLSWFDINAYSSTEQSMGMKQNI